MLVSFPDYFSYTEGKNSLVNGLFLFCSTQFKNWWRNVLKMYYAMSCKAWKYDKTVERQLVTGIIFLRASEHQEMKIHKTWNLYQPQRDPKTILLDIWNSGTSHCQLASSETHTTRSQKSWHSFAGPFSCFAWLSFSTALQTCCLLWLPFIAVCDVT